MDGPRLLLPNAVPIFLAKLRPHRLIEPQNQKRERRTKRILEQGCLSVAMSIVNRTSFYGVAIPSSTLTSTVRARPFSTIHYPPRHGLPTGIRAEQSAVDPADKSVETMRKFSEQYARRSDTFFCVDKSVTSVVIKGLADHKTSLGAPLCPCRHYDDKAAEAKQGFWNCPCVPMRERKECHCMLFLTPDNDFAGTDQTITMEEISETVNGA
ncbi:Ferredoxin-thioredoxin reductase catalytic chain, chloroplastic [Zostera marina]|uniref:Ferredoxin-thioredoxin reductase catalytic chain, chloroplastic n=1 Tax=Zostera marina TaxID=29655 RepID=A0A0K9NKI1_ZOSMR|nr:Ferredoxin-thioredoxin reductase catalytic chain, chloroplastic [Zostera marina]